MRYLRTLSNSLVAAALGTSYVLLLFLQLNPRLSIAPAELLPLITTVGLFYVVHLTAVFYLLLAARHVFTSREFSPAWISVGVLTGLGSLIAAAGSALMWTNLRTFDIVLGPDSRRPMIEGAAILTVVAGLFAAIGVARRRSGGELRRTWGVLTAIVAVLSVALPLGVRGAARTPPFDARPLDATLDEIQQPEGNTHVRVIAIDAGSLELVTAAAAEGRLANFGRMLDSGAVMHLATLHPTSVEAVWSAVATGKLPPKNGVRSAGVYRLANAESRVRLLPDYCFANRLIRFGFLLEEPYTADAVRARPFWNILSLQGLSVGVVNWPLTYPAPAVRGYVVSDVYSRLAPTTSGIVDESMLYPPELRREALSIVQALAADPQAAIPLRTDAALEERFQQAGRTDVLYDQLARTLEQRRPTEVTAIRYQSLDAIGHYFLRYARPSAFGDVSPAEQLALGPVLESHYAAIDEAIGRAIEETGPGDLLLVVSGYGMEPLGFGKRLLERVIGDPLISGTHERAPDGFLMAYGDAVVQGRLPRASVVDVLPTLLYFLGLPVGRDMDGYTRTDLFRPEFRGQRPITFIPTYER